MYEPPNLKLWLPLVYVALSMYWREVTFRPWLRNWMFGLVTDNWVRVPLLVANHGSGAGTLLMNGTTELLSPARNSFRKFGLTVQRHAPTNSFTFVASDALGGLRS